MCVYIYIQGVGYYADAAALEQGEFKKKKVNRGYMYILYM